MERSAVADAAGSLHGFPAALTSFVGRAAVVDEIAGQLGQYRLVTLTGPGGAGKTRLAGEVARRVAGRFADGVWLAELAAVRDPAQVAVAVATALGLRDLPPVPAGAVPAGAVAVADAVARALTRRQLLLVLDNCEHVIGAAAELCGRLLVGADDVRVLATSREPLRIAGEARYRLAPLTLPDPADPADPDGSDAVALFADRARQADASFVLDGQTAPPVAQLVARLDGMPLAIELAAARVESLGVAQLLDRISDRFTLLEAGDRLAAARQRSLAATVEWSYRLLDEPQRRVFRAVSVFPGPFTLAGAEAVAGAGSGPAILHLVDCSLLVPPRAGPDGRSRYAMLETLRAYGAGLLAEAGEGDAVAAALAGYALGVAEDAMAGLTAATSEVARCLSGRSATLLSMSRITEAAEDARRSLAVARDCDHPLAEALALAILGLVACVAGDRNGAVQMARRAEQITAGRHGPAARACGYILTTVLIAADDPAAAELVCTPQLAAARDAGDLWSLGNLLEKMVVLDLNLARFADAHAHLREALQTALRTGSRARVLDDLDCCGYLCALTGRSAEAVTMWAAVVMLQGHEGFSSPADPKRPEGWFQRQEPWHEARRALGPDLAQAAEDRGAAMSLATAAEYALMLTTAGPPPPAAARGAQALSPRERELVTLVAQGHTDAQIASQLFISVRTVSSHLDRIRDKTGCRRRADLTRLALSAGLV